MVLVSFLRTEINDTTAKSAVQDQTACMCMLNLLYSFRKINVCPQEARLRLTTSS